MLCLVILCMSVFCLYMLSFLIQRDRWQFRVCFLRTHFLFLSLISFTLVTRSTEKQESCLWAVDEKHVIAVAVYVILLWLHLGKDIRPCLCKICWCWTCELSSSACTLCKTFWRRLIVSFQFTACFYLYNPMKIRFKFYAFYTFNK